MNKRALLTTVFCLALAPAARAADLGIYIHSANLATQVDALDAAAQASNTLKPYDDQLATMSAFATQEDLAVANLGVARRNSEIQAVLGAGGTKLRADACSRLQVLLPHQACTDADLQNLANVSARLTALLMDVENQNQSITSDLHTFARRFPDAKTPSCTSVSEQLGAARSGSAIYTWLSTVQGSCKTLANFSEGVEALQAKIAPDAKDTGAEAASASISNQAAVNADPDAAAKADSAAVAKSAAASPGVTSGLTDLQNEIAKVQAAAKGTGDLGKLEDFEKNIAAALDKLAPVLQVAGLKSAQDNLAQLSSAATCAGADACQKQLKGTFAGRASAAVGVVNALAQVADTAADRTAAAHAHWLIGAQAIVALHQADAQLQAAADKSKADAAAFAYRTRVREVSLLAATILMADRQGIPQANVAPCAVLAADCALPYYVDSWNEGRIPADILAWRKIQSFRTLTIQRLRLVAQEQRAMLLAGTATLKAYGDGGVDPDTIARFLNALGVVAIAAK